MEDEVGWSSSSRCAGTTNGRTTSDRDRDLDARGTSSLLGVRRPRPHEGE
jgi:hypothetical protein